MQQTANEIVFNIDQIMRVVAPLLTLLGVLLTAAGKAMWKKLNMMQAEIETIKKQLNRIIAQHEINHPGQEVD